MQIKHLLRTDNTLVSIVVSIKAVSCFDVELILNVAVVVLNINTNGLPVVDFFDPESEHVEKNIVGNSKAGLRTVSLFYL